MKNVIAALLCLSLTGCALFNPVPVKRTFPEIPDALKKQCEELKTIEGKNVSITDMLKVVVENYKLYYECSNKVEGWNEWYDNQKQIFDSIK